MFLQKVTSKKLRKTLFFVGVLTYKDENSRIWIQIHWLDPNQYQNVTDPQLCYNLIDCHIYSEMGISDKASDNRLPY
jgi:hypothetical protein